MNGRTRERSRPTDRFSPLVQLSPRPDGGENQTDAPPLSSLAPGPRLQTVVVSFMVTDLSSSAASACVRLVPSFDALAATPFTGNINAHCWTRTLAGDFGAVVAALGAGEGIETLDEERLRALTVSDAGRVAIEQMLHDARLLRDRGLDPVLNCIHGYARDDDGGPVPTDVFSFHADSAPVPADTWLCTYHGPTSEGIANPEARRRIDVPETRAALLQQFGGEDNAEFRAFLQENCYDLHYVALPAARPYSFGLGNLWRIAVDYPGSPVPPCIHRAPTTQPGDPPRLLLIS